MILADFHVHTKASDGNFSPKEAVMYAISKMLETIVITDHNTTHGVQEAQKLANECGGITVYSGIEIASPSLLGEIDLTFLEVLGINIDLIKIQPFVEEMARIRLHDLEEVVGLFNKYIECPDFKTTNSEKTYSFISPREINVQELVKWKNNEDSYENESPYFSHWDIAFYIFEIFNPSLNIKERLLNGEINLWSEIQNEYDFLFKRKQEKVFVGYAIQTIKDAGGIAIWAHPGRPENYETGLIKEWEKPESMWFDVSLKNTPFTLLKQLKEMGLNGVELYYYEGNTTINSEEQEKINLYFSNAAKRLGLSVTYGSDCHGPRRREPLIGKFGSPSPDIFDQPFIN